ncbi:MAG: methyltransferase domain-containing protein [Candidatus Omnitrophota bacterium]
MCHEACIDFGKINLRVEDVKDKDVIEVGASDLNGSLRSTIEALGPKKYVGVDIQSGKGVDIICKAEDLIRYFGSNKFDVLIATEVIEHVSDWEKVISNFKNILKPNGVIIITTRSKGFHYHGFPFDFWRYELSDMEYIFSDFIIEVAEKDPLALGIFIKARKPENFIENNLSTYRLYSIDLNKKSTVREIALCFPFFYIIRTVTNKWPEAIKKTEAYKKFKAWKKAHKIWFFILR